MSTRPTFRVRDVESGREFTVKPGSVVWNALRHRPIGARAEVFGEFEYERLADVFADEPEAT